MQADPARHHPALVLLHWLLALLIVLMLAVGSLLLAPMPNSAPGKITALRAHMAVGAVILLLMLARVVVRRRTRRPPPAATGHAVLDFLATATHTALYLLVFGMAFSGLGIALLADLPATVFAGRGTLPASFADLPPRTAHGLMAWALMAALALHLAGVAYHQLVRRDGLLKRMAIGRAGSG